MIKNNFLKKYFYYFLSITFCFFFFLNEGIIVSNANAASNNPLTYSNTISITEINISKNFTRKIESSILSQINQALFIFKKHNINIISNITINILQDSENFYLSQGIGNQCNINIKINPEKYFELKENEFSFILLHELAHCFIGTDKIGNAIIWNKYFSEDDKIKAKSLFNKQEKQFLKNVCLSCKNKFQNITIASPSIIYEELKAESLAAIWWIKFYNDTKLLAQIYENRFFNHEENVRTSHHPTHYVLDEIFHFFKIEQLSVKNFEIYAQHALFTYLQAMENYYD